MANTNNGSADGNQESPKESDLEKSFVAKFMSGIINSTPLSKWFGKEAAVIRKREEDEDYGFQPPLKRSKPSHYNDLHNGKLWENCEPIAGPSGIKSRKLFDKNTSASTNTASTNSLVNGNDSDSEESTSGYSSAPKLVVNKEETQTKHKSLFTQAHDSERTLFSPQSTSLSSRRPTFNASTFNSPNFVDRTLSTKRIMNSPFYSGRTMYGGASAYGRRLTKIDDSNIKSVQIKPINPKSTNDNMTLSKTARRILSTLEQYSTPITDAKKIPVAPRKSGLLTSSIGANPYLIKKKPITRELQVPELLQMKQKERIQNVTETVRQIANTNQNKEYKLREDKKYSNKIKTSVTSLRQKNVTNEVVEEVKLPKVSLPITTLPKFDFNLSKPKDIEFVFSEPLIISKDLKAINAINCFKFSEPLIKQSCDNIKVKNNGENVTIKSGVKNGFGEEFKLTDKKWECSCCLVRNDTTTSKCVACGVDKEKPLVGHGFGDKFKPSGSTWECNICLIRNKNEVDKCEACGGSKTSEKQLNKTVESFGDQFKKKNDEWECSVCMVRNKTNVEKCVACETLKPGSSTNTEKLKTTFSFGITGTTEKPKETFSFEVPNSTNIEKPKTTFSFGVPGTTTSEKPKIIDSNCTEKPKPTFNLGIPSQWDCLQCSEKNLQESTKCVKCGKEKQTFGDLFRKKIDEWECTSCMVRNKTTDKTCVCCGNTKPGSFAEKITINDEDKPIIGFNFGVAKKSEFSFGIPKDEKVTTAPPSFDVSKNEKITPSFGVSKSETIVPNVGFQFKPINGDIDKEKLGTPESKQENVVTKSVVFDSSKTVEKPTTAIISKPIDGFFTKKEESKPQESIFANNESPKPIFGNTKPLENPVFAPTTTTFNFTAPKPSETTNFTSKPAEVTSFQITSPPSIFKFGANDTTNPPEVKNGFEPTKPIQFNFGSNSTTESKSNFSFEKPVFNFGSNTSTSQNNTGFNFTAPSTTAFNFGSGNPTFPTPNSNVFGGNNKASFNFGAANNNNNQKAVFSFGGNQTTNAPTAAATSGFNFGSPTSLSVPSGGFNFTGAPPTFNFTDGSAQAQPPRKIKKALRRTHR